MDNTLKGVNDMFDKSQLGELIKRIRIRMGMTQEEFGKLIDNSTKSMVSKWERGETLPNSQRKVILIHLGEQVGIDLYPNDEVEGLLKYAEREFYRIYVDFISKQFEPSDKKFQRAVLTLNPESLKEEFVQSVYPTYYEQSISPANYEIIVHDYIKMRIKGKIHSYPSSDDVIMKQLITDIEALEAKLLLYYFTPDGRKYDIEDLSTEQYGKLHNILDFARFQLKNLSQK